MTSKAVTSAANLRLTVQFLIIHPHEFEALNPKQNIHRGEAHPRARGEDRPRHYAKVRAGLNKSKIADSKSTVNCVDHSNCLFAADRIFVVA